MTQIIVNNGWSTGSPRTRSQDLGGVVVCVAAVPTRPTMELGLTPSISFVDPPTSGTFSAAVSRIDEQDRHANKSGFVGYKRPQLMECPVSHARPLSTSDSCPSSDALEILQRNSSAGALRLCHDGLRDSVIGNFLKPSLFPFQSIDLAPCSAGAFLLQIAPPVGMNATKQFDLSAAVACPVAVGSDVDDTEINADPVFRVKFLGLWYVACADQKPFAPDISEIGFPFAKLHQRALPLASDPRKFDATVNRPKRHDVIRLEAHKPVIVGLSGKTPEPRANFSVNLKRIGYFGDAANSSLSCQVKALAAFFVGQLVQIELANLLFFKGSPGEPRACQIATLKSRFQGRFLLWRCLEFYRGTNLHKLKYRRFSALFQHKIGRAFLPAVNGRVSCAIIR